MTDHPPAPMNAWLIEPMAPAVAEAIGRLRRAPDVQQLAVMPDVHLAQDVCVGTVVATSRLLYPQAVGGDIGCGMLAIPFDATAAMLADPALAGRMLAAIRRAVPPLRRHRRAVVPYPCDLADMRLSDPALDAVRRGEGSFQLGTLGSGNHFIELQADEQDSLWLMIHSGSRAIGQAVASHHLARAERVCPKLRALDAETDAGRALLLDVAWARRYADANRRAIAGKVAEALSDLLGGITARWEMAISIDHNHIVREEHEGGLLWVHRKGAMPAGEGMRGVLPGSMGTASFHVMGRGCPRSLCSSAHGAGRALSRQAARRMISNRDLQRQMEGIWYDYRLLEELRDEAPAAYKDIRAVLRAQRELVKVERILRPVLNYKGR